MSQDFDGNAQKCQLLKMMCFCILVRNFKKLTEFMLVLLLWSLDRRGERGSERCFCYWRAAAAAAGARARCRRRRR